MNRTLDRLTKYYDLTDMNLHRVWDKLHHLQQDQEYIVETIDLMNKVLLDLNLNRRLAAEEAQVNIRTVPKIRQTVPLEQLLSSTIAPIEDNRHTLIDSIENIEAPNNQSQSSLSKRSNLETTISEIKNRTRTARNYCLDNKMIFSDWLEFLKAELEYSDLLQYIRPENSEIESAERSKINSIIKDIIISRVDKSFQSKIISMKDPLEILKKLKEMRLIRRNFNTFDLKGDFFKIKMKPGEKVSEVCDRFDSMIKMYDESEPPEPLSEHDKASAFFSATKERCEELRQSNWMQKAKSHTDMTVDEMRFYLLQAEAHRADAPRVRAIDVMINKCYRCNEEGHMGKDCHLKEDGKRLCYQCRQVTDDVGANCPQRRRYVDDIDNNKNKGKNERGSGRGKSRGGGKSRVGGRNKSRIHPYSKNQSKNTNPTKEKKGECFKTQLNSRLENTKQHANHIEFTADSGATEHITNKGFVLRDFEKCNGEIKCTNSDERANISMDSRGTLYLKSVIDSKNIELSNVILATNASENLMSLRKFVESGYSIYLDDEKSLISDKLTGENYLTGIYESPN
ncbi:hypothetical protein TKK_0015641 [Trichogramma kaykai]